MTNFDTLIGDIRVTRIEEAVFPASRPADRYSDYDADALAPLLSWLAPKYYSVEDQRALTSVHSWLLRTPDKVILVDTCTGNHKDRPGFPAFHQLETPYLDRLRAAGVTPEQVDIVLCTHLHVDHVGWNTRLADGHWVPTFPNARYLMSMPDFEHFSAGMRNPKTSAMTRNTFSDSVQPIVDAGLAEFVDGHEDIAPGLRLRPAPGHTPGQIRLDLASNGRMACFCGDVLHHPLQVPLWHWKTRICADPELACRTRHDVLDHCERTGALMLPAHFDHPYGAYIGRQGETFSLHWPDQPGGPDPRGAAT